MTVDERKEHDECCEQGCGYGCHWENPYGFVMMAGCPEHDEGYDDCPTPEKWGEFDREELQSIRFRAEGLAGCAGMASTWRRAYEALALAADHLDAMTARSTESVDFETLGKASEDG